MVVYFPTFWTTCKSVTVIEAKTSALQSNRTLRVIFSENRESEDTHENSIFLLFRQNIPLSELIQGNVVLSSHDLFYGRNLGKIEICM